MSTDTTRFYNYSSSNSASLVIPFRSAKQLGWLPQNYNPKRDFKREINYFKKAVEGKKGLFLFVNKKKKDTLKFYKYASQSASTVTVPLNLADTLGWRHKDQIRLVLKIVDGYMGLLFYKE